MAHGTLLLSIPKVSAFQTGPGSAESVLVTCSTLTVQLVDIPSTVLKTVPSSSAPPSYDADLPIPPVVVDTWLVLSLANDLIEIPLSANSVVCFQAPRSYILPGVGDDYLQQSPPTDDAKKDCQSGIRLEFPEGLEADALDTLDGILAGWASYSGRAPSAAPTEVQTGALHCKQGRLALMDEKTGEICGELTSEIVIDNKPSASTASLELAHAPPHPTSVLIASQQPVMVSLHPSSSQEPGSNLTVAEISSSPTSGSSLLSGAEWVSRGIVAGADWLTSQILASEKTYISHTKPVTEPITFSANTKARTERVVGFTKMATKVSGQATRMIGGIATRVGDKVGKATGIQHGPTGEAPKGARGYVARGVLAFNTVMDSIEYSGKKVLSTAGSSATTMVTHSHGPEAGQLTGKGSEAVQNVALVYIDARGVTRKALLKAAGKAAVRGKMNDGREVVFGSDANVEKWTEQAEVVRKEPKVPSGK